MKDLKAVELKPIVKLWWEKAYDKIMAGVEEASPAKQKIFHWAEKQGREAVNIWQAGKPLPLRLNIR